MLEGYQQYITDVTTGKAVVCKYVRQAVERQLNDLKRQRTPDFPYYFDEEEASRWIGFIRCLRHTSGEWKGKHFLVQDFQEFRWACIFGWRRVDGKGRRFRRAFVEVARKQGKTEEAAAIALGGMIIDGEQTAQIFSAATTRQQAQIVYSAAKMMARELRKDSEYMEKALKLLAHRIMFEDTDSFMQALSADAWTLDGLSPHIAIIDEFHAHPNNEVLKVIETGMGARRSPLTYIITTSGFNFQSPWYHVRQNAIDLLNGTKVDETFFGVIYTLDEGDDWNDKSTWIKANPQIGVTPTWEFMDSEYTKAVNEGGRSEVEFKTKNLNVPVGVSEVWIQDELWQACPSEYDVEKLKGRMCYMGIDFASVSDFTALVLYFPPENEDEAGVLLPFFWIPGDIMNMQSRDLPDLLRWSKPVAPGEFAVPGAVMVTPGNYTDYDYLTEEVRHLFTVYDVRAIGYDPQNAWQTIGKLEQDGYPMDVFRQHPASMSPSAKEFERLVRMQTINHLGNPVLRWMLSNCVPYYDNNKNLKVTKMKESRGVKIDGIIASIIAIGEHLKNPQADVYSKSGIFYV